MIVLDTHVLVWTDSDDRKLGRKARAMIDQLCKIGKVAAPAIVLWEVGLLQARRRLRLPTSVHDWRHAMDRHDARK